jgi:hypothetical protein
VLSVTSDLKVSTGLAAVESKCGASGNAPHEFKGLWPHHWQRSLSLAMIINHEIRTKEYVAAIRMEQAEKPYEHDREYDHISW